jgi:formylglycine-generating enzyme required for sulfatase activity
MALVKIAVTKSGNALSGTIVFGGQTYQFTGTPEHGTLRSNFTAGDKKYPFKLVNNKGKLRFQTGSFHDDLVKEGVVYVEATDMKIIHDRELWAKASKEEQDKLIVYVGDKLKADYEFVWTKKYDCAKQSYRIATFRHIKSGLLLNLVPGGTYKMGSSARDAIDEKPVHKARVKAMLIGQFEMRQKVWDKVRGADQRKWKGPELPLERVSFPAARSWMEKAGGGLRFPSESEWEHACRAGSKSPYYWGDVMDKSHCWYARSSGRRAHDVTEHYQAKKWNAFGLVDMLGNVCEWVQDDYIGDYKNGPNTEKARVNKGRGKKVIRGGSWYHVARNALGSADRLSYTTNRTDYILGFRVARSLPK